MSDENKNSNNVSNLRFKYENLEFEISGTEKFIEKIFSQIIESISPIHINEEIIEESKIEQELKSPEITEIPENELPEININDTDIPLDKFLEQYSTESLQKKTLAVCLYLIEVLKTDKFRSRDINKLLTDNKFSPIQSIATHIMRLREKGLISIVGKQGEKEAIISIYKDHIQKVKDFLIKS